MDEQNLILEAQAGNNKALSELVKKYEKTIYSFAFKVCRNPENAENTMQETFMSMVKSLKQFDGKSKLSTWLYRITANHCLMEYRKRKHNYVSIDDEDALISEESVADWSGVPSFSIENKELKSVLDNAIQKLSAEYRMVFLLRDVEGLSTEETGKIVELSVPAVKSRLHRARAFLRKEISQTYKR